MFQSVLIAAAIVQLVFNLGGAAYVVDANGLSGYWAIPAFVVVIGAYSHSVPELLKIPVNFTLGFIGAYYQMHLPIWVSVLIALPAVIVSICQMRDNGAFRRFRRISAAP